MRPIAVWKSYDGKTDFSNLLKSKRFENLKKRIQFVLEPKQQTGFLLTVYCNNAI